MKVNFIPRCALVLMSLSLSFCALPQKGSLRNQRDHLEGLQDGLGNRNFEQMTEIYLPHQKKIWVKKSAEKKRTTYEDEYGREIQASQLPSLAVRIANGGGGQVGLIEALANQYLKENQKGSGEKSPALAWRATNTSGSLESLEKGWVDVAIVYDKQKEVLALSGTPEKPHFASRIKHVWMDHFMLIGPTSDPAHLRGIQDLDAAIDQIMIAPESFWLTRNDHSAIHEFEKQKVLTRVNLKRQRVGLSPLSLSELVKEGERALHAQKDYDEKRAHWLRQREEGSGIHLRQAHSQMLQAQRRISEVTAPFRGLYKRGFYRPIQLMPKEAILKANELGYYTLADHGTFYFLSRKETLRVQPWIDGMDQAHPELFNPADALLTSQKHSSTVDHFFEWLGGETAQDLIQRYSGVKDHQGDPLFKRAKPDLVADRDRIFEQL